MSNQINVSKSLAESMAIAVLKGDMLAAIQLADMIRNEFVNGNNLEAQAQVIKNDHGPAVQSIEVYRSKEFETFCKRFGIAWSMMTRSITIYLPVEGMLGIEQSYFGYDMGSDNAEELNNE